MTNQKNKLKSMSEQEQIARAKNAEHASDVFFRMLALVPDEHHADLIELMSDESRVTDPEAAKIRLRIVFDAADLETNRAEIVRLLLELIPVSEVVPSAYKKYRPMVADAAEIILAKLGADRLKTKLVEQVMLPLDASLHERLLMLITRMPTIQKLGQIIARNRHLDPKLRRMLQKLENGIRDVTYEAVCERIQSELKRKLPAHDIKLGPKLLSEATVCAVVPFTWNTPDGERAQGVFKVLKPFISDYFAEELRIFHALAVHLDRRRGKYGLPTVGFRELLREVRELFKREVRLSIEQDRLREALDFYAEQSDVRIPRLLPFRTKVLTGMEFMEGMKVTAAAQKFPELRPRIAELILDKLILSVLFYPGENALFHADPHAGNVFYHPAEDELVILDWGLSCMLDGSRRRWIVQLMLGFILHDKERAFKAAAALTGSNPSPEQSDIIRKRVDDIIDGLPLFPLVRLEPLTQLLDELILDGVRFPAELLMFRKSLFTLIGVIHDVDPDFNLDWHVTRSLVRQIVGEIPSRLTKSPWSTKYPSRLSTVEFRSILAGLSKISAQLGLQIPQFVAGWGLEWAEGLFSAETPQPEEARP